MTAPDWRDRAACRGTDPETFFPVSERGVGATEVDEAKAVCARCPRWVREACLAYALDRRNRIEFGVWGGTSTGERRAIREGQALRPRPVPKAKRKPRLVDRWVAVCEAEPGITIRAAAVELGVTPNTLYNALSHARQRGDKRVPQLRPKDRQDAVIEQYLPLHAAGLSDREIADRLQVKRGTLRVMLSRARSEGDTRVPAAAGSGGRPRKAVAA